MLLKLIWPQKGSKSTKMKKITRRDFIKTAEISTFTWAWKAGMTPAGLDEIEVRGEKLADVRRNFIRPTIYPWDAIRQYGPPC